jgi:hypothetical protein
MRKRNFEFTKEKVEIEDGLFVTYHYNVERIINEEDFHGRQIIDESEVTDLFIEAVYVWLNEDYAELKFDAMSPEQLMYIECKLKY